MQKLGHVWRGSSHEEPWGCRRQLQPLCRLYEAAVRSDSTVAVVEETKKNARAVSSNNVLLRVKVEIFCGSQMAMSIIESQERSSRKLAVHKSYRLLHLPGLIGQYSG